MEEFGCFGKSVLIYVSSKHIPNLSMQKKTPNDSHSWLLTIVYGSPNCTLRKYIWQDLNQNVVNLEEPWVVVSDFNSVTSTEETTRSENLD